MSYAELDVTSNFTFLTGASHPEEYIRRADALGLTAIGIADTNSFAGIVRAHAAAEEVGVRFLVGVRLVLADGQTLLAYPQDRASYGRLCRLLTLGKGRTVKGKCLLYEDDILEWAKGSILICRHACPGFLARLAARFPDHVYIALTPQYDGEDPSRFAKRASLAQEVRLPLIATGNVLMHRSARRRLADILTCIRESCTVDTLGQRALLNSERRLKSPFEMLKFYQGNGSALSHTLDVVARCRFSLSELKYEYPDEISDGKPPFERLRELTAAGLVTRYPDGVPLKVQAMVEREFTLIRKLDYARYFLTVYDVVKFAREQNILCQGRGSAANSVVCYALGITSIGPETIAMVFERFLSEARNEPPDIDVDFEHERREEVIQHIYQKYGRDRAGICATVIHFRSKRAIREVGKAMGLSHDTLTTLSAQVWGHSSSIPYKDRLRAAGLDSADHRITQTMQLIEEIIGFPRHLSQHVGGFVMTKGRLDELVPVENAAMEGRTVIEWDKDDIDVLGMLKVDILALGMLTCIRNCFELIASWKGTHYTLATIPQGDPDVYHQISQGDTVGLFQIESRAQMAFLPRMRPQCFYDLVIEVAIIRPGPIQGDMVHPYLKRRRGEEPVTYPSEALEQVLKRTLGVPLFQEQAMQIVMVAARFSPSEADGLRRSLAAFRHQGNVSDYRERFISGCLENGYEQDFAERCFSQLEGFSGYGFPESHAASFALLVYASAWFRHHHPEVYACAILNAQPMGFYAPPQLVADAKAHGVTILPVDINASAWDCTLEPDGRGALAVRLGFRIIKGLKEDDAMWISAARGHGYADITSVWRRASLPKQALEKLAMADAFASLGLTRRDALWHAKALDPGKPMPLLDDSQGEEIGVPTHLPAMSHTEDVFEDYISTRLSLKDHPVRLVRPLAGDRLILARALRDVPQNGRISLIGAVITRQRPATASGVIFLTLEDESGQANCIVWVKTFQKFRAQVMQGRLLKVTGRVQKEGKVIHLIAEKIADLSHLFDQMGHSQKDRVDMTWSGQDETRQTLLTVKKPKPAPPSPARHPREQAKRLFRSRDFH
ncbi:MAG: error-prone DNA polymerase [Parvularcula sp.]